MVKYECAQEIILDLVMRYGCEVKIKPHPYLIQNAIEVVIYHNDINATVTIDTSRTSPFISNEEIACRAIMRATMDLFRYPYDRIYDKHFGDGDGNG